MDFFEENKEQADSIEEAMIRLALIEKAERSNLNGEISINLDLEDFIENREDSEEIMSFIDESMILFLNNLWGALKSDYKMVQYIKMEEDSDFSRVGIYQYDESLTIDITYEKSIGTIISFETFDNN